MPKYILDEYSVDIARWEVLAESKEQALKMFENYDSEKQNIKLGKMLSFTPEIFIAWLEKKCPSIVPELRKANLINFDDGFIQIKEEKE
jgi:hypothetical protein